jgi:putative salt-induced outer membrane protein YdiY
MLTSLSTIFILSLFAQTTGPKGDSELELEGNFDLGVAVISGNSKSANSSLNYDLSYLHSVHKLDFGLHYQGVRDTDQTSDISTTSSRLYRSSLQYNYYFSEDKETYLWTNVANRQDKPSGLINRINAGSGVGYHILLGEDIDLNFEIGAAYVDEKKASVLSESTVTRFAIDLSWPITDNLSIHASSEFLSSPDIETYGQDFNLRYSLENNWYLQLSNNTAYDAYPSAGSLTTDSRFNLTLGTSF